MKRTIFISLTMLMFGICNIGANTIIKIEKELTYDQYTLDDIYPYRQGTREFQWGKIKDNLLRVDALRAQNDSSWAILQNKSNANGKPANARDAGTDAYHAVTDRYGVQANQAIPLFLADDLKTPDRYALDGSLVNIIAQQDDFVLAKTTTFEGEFLIPAKYVHRISGVPAFAKVIVVDRTNQNIATFEKVDDVWKVRSMNPATTGVHRPPYQKETPLGLFVLQTKVAKMQFYADGTTRIAGFAPWASRFSAGGYIHGIPVNLPATEIVEFSGTLGTTPRSHMCVRNASSHAKFIYDNFAVDDTIVFVIE